MLKKLSIAAIVGLFSLTSLPVIATSAMAQGTGTEPPSAPAPSDAKDASGSMSKSSMSKGSMSKSGSMKSHKSMGMKHKKKSM